MKYLFVFLLLITTSKTSFAQNDLGYTVTGKIEIKIPYNNQVQQQQNNSKYRTYRSQVSNIIVMLLPRTQELLNDLEAKRFECNQKSNYEQRVVTNQNGDYSFINVKEGRYIIVVCNSANDYYKFKIIGSGIGIRTIPTITLSKY